MVFGHGIGLVGVGGLLVACVAGESAPSRHRDLAGDAGSGDAAPADPDVAGDPLPDEPAPLHHVTYTASDASFPNPERGFYRHLETRSSDHQPLDAGELAALRDEDLTLILRLYYLDSFATSAISSSYLDAIEADLDALRTAGQKAILRFAYSWTTGGWPPTAPYGDADPAQMAAHIEQLAPVLSAHGDVIAVVQAGFIGLWGEWYYTTYFGDPMTGGPDADDHAARAAIFFALQDAVGPSRVVQLRTPEIKRRVFDVDEPLSAADALGDSRPARAGHHNDCFLASASDYGTYVDLDVDYAYLEAETEWLPMGGETCNPNPPRSECATALEELSLFHWSYLNDGYHPDVLDGFSTGGCIEEIRRRLGYRLRLVEGRYGEWARRGGGWRVELLLANDGLAAPMNPRGVEVRLVPAAGGPSYEATLLDDARTLVPGAPHALNADIGVPADMPPGSYEVFLCLPDAASSLAARPEYAIRLANSDLWQASTGCQALSHSLFVEATAAMPGYAGGSWLAP